MQVKHCFHVVGQTMHQLGTLLDNTCNEHVRERPTPHSFATVPLCSIKSVFLLLEDINSVVKKQYTGKRKAQKKKIWFLDGLWYKTMQRRWTIHLVKFWDIHNLDQNSSKVLKKRRTLQHYSSLVTYDMIVIFHITYRLKTQLKLKSQSLDGRKLPPKLHW